MRLENPALNKHKVACTFPINNPLPSPFPTLSGCEKSLGERKGSTRVTGLVCSEKLVVQCIPVLATECFLFDKPNRQVLEVGKGNSR